MEGDLVIRHAQVEHPNSNPSFTMEHMKAIGDMGAFLNISYNAINPLFAGRHPKEGADIVKEVGAEHCTVITDGGQHTSPGPAEGMRVFCNMLMHLGVKRKEIDLMIKTNPAIILGLND